LVASDQTLVAAYQTLLATYQTLVAGDPNVVATDQGLVAGDEQLVAGDQALVSTDKQRIRLGPESSRLRSGVTGSSPSYETAPSETFRKRPRTENVSAKLKWRFNPRAEFFPPRRDHSQTAPRSLSIDHCATKKRRSNKIRNPRAARKLAPFGAKKVRSNSIESGLTLYSSRRAQSFQAMRNLFKPCTIISDAGEFF
jgi:hypothetical protein